MTYCINGLLALENCDFSLKNTLKSVVNNSVNLYNFIWLKIN